jgi:hypothetical protein
MSITAQQLLASFDALPETGKFEVALEILRRTKDFKFPPLTDDELIDNAEAVFLELDRREMSNKLTESW